MKLGQIPSFEITALLLLSSLLTFAVPSPAHAQGSTTLLIWSPDASSPDLADLGRVVGSMFIIEVKVADLPTTGINGFDITVSFDHTIINASAVDDKSPVCPASDGCLFDSTSTLNLASSVDNAAGTARMAAVILGSTVQGSGILFRITFRVSGTGFTRINIQQSISLIVNASTRVPYTAINGSFSNAGPDFTLQVTPQSVNVSPGSSVSTSVYLTSVSGFVGNVTLSATVSSGPGGPGSLTLSGLPSQISLINGGANSSILTVAAAGNAPLGVYTVMVSGTGGNATHSASLVVNVSTPDFSISSSPSFLSLQAGQAGFSTILVTSLGGFQGNVSLGSTASPGITSSLVPTDVSLSFGPSAFSTLTLSSTLATPLGSHNITVTGTSGSLHHSTLVVLNVTLPPQPTPTLPRWVSNASIPTPREGYGAVAIGGLLYYVAGYSFGDTTINQAYDPTTNSWSNRTSLPGNTRSETTAVTDGTFLYLIGGRPVPVVGNELWRYDPKADSWTSLAPMPTARATEQMAAYFNGHVYVVGGRTGGVPGGAEALSTLEIYDITSNTWTTGSPMPEPRSDASVILNQGRIYVFGGIDASGNIRDTTFIYDITSDTWTTGTALPSARASQTSGVCGPLVYAIGGWDLTRSLQTSSFAYDPRSDSWSMSLPIPSPTGEAEGVSTPGRIYVVSGGIFGSGSFNNANFVFECSKDILYVSPASQPVQSPGTTVTYNVKVDGMDRFTGWDITTASDPAVLNPQSLSITGNLLSANFSATVTELVNCVNGTGKGCTSRDGPGIAHSAVTLSTPVIMSSPVSGLLFTISYKAVAGTFSPISISDDVLSTGPCCPILHSTIGGIYGTPPPDFGLAAFPSVLVVGQHSHGTTSISVTSLNGLTGAVSLTASVSPNGPVASLSPTSLTLVSNGSGSSILTISTTPSTALGNYNITVTGTGVGHSHSLRVRLTIVPDFTIASSPSSLNLSLDSSGVSTIVLSSQGFSGIITLATTISPSLFDGPSVFLSTTSVNLPTNGAQSLTLSIFTSFATHLGSYNVTVTATSGRLSHSSTVSVVVHPPTILLSPSSGVLGTQVHVRGSGFPTGGQVNVDVSFDDQFLGFIFPTNGTFDFTFNVPHAEPGLHSVKAFTFVFTGFGSRLIEGTAPFTVLAPSAKLSVNIDVGALFFPGDTVDVYTLVTVDGSPGSLTGLQLQLVLIAPNGTSINLASNSVGPGLFKASFKLPKSGGMGTYALVATAHAAGAVDGSGLATFEVKPSWLSAQGPRIASATAIAGVLGVVIVAWRKGLFRRKDEDPLAPY